MDAWQKQAEDRFKRLEDGMAKLNNAFPAGDVEGHRRYHDALIEDFQTRKRLVQTLKEKTVIAIIWSLCVWVVMACWHEFQRRMGQ
jgi:hypothetical protein